jgi:multiple sugar transport system permease protein
MHRIVFGRRTVRTAILIPYGIITVVAAYAWQYAFALDSGFVNEWFGLGDKAWFSDRWSALTVIILAEVWKTTPFISLLLLAGLVQVPEELQVAAKVDGATAWQRLWRVTVPNMKAAIMVALLFRTLDAYRIFDTIFIMTGGAEKTESVSFLTYRQTIVRTELGLGSAVSVLLFLSVVLIAVGFIKAFRVDLSRVRGD